MAWTTPRTWSTGEVVTASIMNTHIRDNLNAAFPNGAVSSAWTTFTPTLTQSGTVTKTVTYASYMKIGRLVIANVLLAVTGSGTGGNGVKVGLPVTAAQAGNMACGSFWIIDSSAVTNYTGVAELDSTSVVKGVANAQSSELGSASFTAALASGDTVSYAVMYEAAS